MVRERYYPGIYMEELRKTKKYVNQDYRCLDQVLNTEQKYNTRKRRSV